MNDSEVTRWLKASHDMIELFWQGYGEYSLALKWVGEWFDSGRFVVTSGDRKKLDNMTKQFMPGFDEGQFGRLLEQLREGEQENVGLAVMPFLFSWNIQRFKEYFRRRPAFTLGDYCTALGGFITERRLQIAGLRNKRLHRDKIDSSADEVIDLVNTHLKQIGMGQNEPVGTAKLLHVLAPHFFPLVDNAIAEAMLLKQRGETLTKAAYRRWMERLRDWLLKHRAACAEAEEQLGVPILKLVDEGLYLMCTVHSELPKMAANQLGF
jgi:hypothetical protein